MWTVDEESLLEKVALAALQQIPFKVLVFVLLLPCTKVLIAEGERLPLAVLLGLEYRREQMKLLFHYTTII
jgi:hypothetical protein